MINLIQSILFRADRKKRRLADLRYSTRFTFHVDKKLKKPEIKQIFQELFNTQVTKVQTLIIPPKKHQPKLKRVFVNFQKTENSYPWFNARSFFHFYNSTNKNSRFGNIYKKFQPFFNSLKKKKKSFLTVNNPIEKPKEIQEIVRNVQKKIKKIEKISILKKEKKKKVRNFQEKSKKFFMPKEFFVYFLKKVINRKKKKKNKYRMIIEMLQQNKLNKLSRRKIKQKKKKKRKRNRYQILNLLNQKFANRKWLKFKLKFPNGQLAKSKPKSTLSKLKDQKRPQLIPKTIKKRDLMKKKKFQQVLKLKRFLKYRKDQQKKLEREELLLSTETLRKLNLIRFESKMFNFKHRWPTRKFLENTKWPEIKIPKVSKLRLIPKPIWLAKSKLKSLLLSITPNTMNIVNSMKTKSVLKSVEKLNRSYLSHPQKQRLIKKPLTPRTRKKKPEPRWKEIGRNFLNSFGPIGKFLLNTVEPEPKTVKYKFEKNLKQALKILPDFPFDPLSKNKKKKKIIKKEFPKNKNQNESLKLLKPMQNFQEDVMIEAFSKTRKSQTSKAQSILLEMSETWLIKIGAKKDTKNLKLKKTLLKDLEDLVQDERSRIRTTFFLKKKKIVYFSSLSKNFKKNLLTLYLRKNIDKNEKKKFLTTVNYQIKENIYLDPKTVITNNTIFFTQEKKKALNQKETFNQKEAFTQEEAFYPNKKLKKIVHFISKTTLAPSYAKPKLKKKKISPKKK